jgi:YHS domain-containing protein
MLRFALLFLLLTLLVRAGWRLLAGVVDGIAGQSRRGESRPTSVPMVRDPVCGTFVVPDRAFTLAERGHAVHFCSTACRDKYRTRTA